VRWRTRTQAARLVVTLAGALAAAALPAAGGADSASTYQERAQALRDANAALSARSSTVVLELYALDSRLTQARARLAALQSRAAALRHQRDIALRRLGVARRTLAVSRDALAERLRALYIQGDVDPLAVLLGAGSLDEALARIEQLDRTASANRRVVAQARAAQRKFRRLAETLARRTAAVERLEADAAASASALARARSERAGYLAQLATKQRLNRRQIAGFESAAAAAEAKAQALVRLPVPAADDPGSTGSPPVAGRRLTVSVTGYSLPGRTATGIPVGWGVVAVDPSVIPLGTRMTIPGYGQGVAADVGGSVRGAAIDVWFPTVAQAMAWGRRTVTITLH
jgi:cystine transport system substrate-binding protein